MKLRLKIAGIALGIFLMTAIMSKAQKTTHFDYTNNTFTYSENGVVKTANLTGQATAPSHIMDGSNPLITIDSESPVRKVTIPRQNSTFFIEASEYRSRYEMNNELNIYKNKIGIRPSTEEDFNAIGNNPQEYVVTRTSTNDFGGIIKKTIASVSFIPAGQGGYDYTISYFDGTQVTEPVFDDEQPVTEGHIANFSESTVTVIDRFTASTYMNRHEWQYTYKFEQGDHNCSNAMKVPVLKTNHLSKLNQYTYEEIVSDSLRTLDANSTKIEFYLVNDPELNITQYDVYHVDGNTNPHIGRAENTGNSGNYDVFALSENGLLNNFIETLYSYPYNYEIPESYLHSAIASIPDSRLSVLSEQHGYVPVTTSLYNGNINKVNTYGSSIVYLEYPTVKLTNTHLEKTNPYAGANCQLMSYRVDLKITSELKVDFPYAFYYRVWRLVDGNTMLQPVTLLNTIRDFGGGSGDETWGSNYAEIQQTYPVNGDIMVTDFFQDYKIEDEKEVTYIVRLYATDYDNYYSPLDDIKTTPKVGADGLFVVAEDMLTVVFNDDVVTSIENLSEESQVLSVTYYNMLGIPSDRAHQGVNLKVTRYGNGTVTKTKMINK